jgi:hypothetical protein
MAFLQLADNYSMLAQNRSENYIFIPAGYAGATKDMNVREDYFDNLTDAEYMAMMQELAPYQNQGLSAVGAALIAGKAIGAKLGPFAKNLIDRRKARVAAGTAKPLFKPGGLISRIGDKIKAKQAGAGDLQTVTTQNNLPVDTRGGGSGSFEFNIDDQAEPAQTFFQKYKMPILIGGGLLVVGGIILATRKKRR